jgi:hypothetical protein
MRGFTEMRYWRRRHEPFDLEAELKDSRPQPSPDLVHQLEARVRDSGRTRVGSLRVAFVGALTAVMLAGVSAVGGAGYASSAARDAAVSVKRVVTPKEVVKVLKRSAAQQQYGPTKPTRKTTKAKAKKVKKAKKGKGAKGRVRARTRPPFTG